MGELFKPVTDLLSALRGDRSLGRVLVGIGYLILGGAIGFAASLDFPGRFLPRAHTIPGLSLVLAPLATGLAMHFFGKWRRERGGAPTRLATYWGGGLFAFGAALARFLMVGR